MNNFRYFKQTERYCPRMIHHCPRNTTCRKNPNADSILDCGGMFGRIHSRSPCSVPENITKTLRYRCESKINSFRFCFRCAHRYQRSCYLVSTTSPAGFAVFWTWCRMCFFLKMHCVDRKRVNVLKVSGFKRGRLFGSSPYGLNNILRLRGFPFSNALESVYVILKQTYLKIEFFRTHSTNFDVPHKCLWDGRNLVPLLPPAT